METPDIKLQEEAIDKLSAGLLMLYQPELVKFQDQLHEIGKKQRKLIELTHNENLKFSECQSSEDLISIVNKIKLYHPKLIHLKKKMILLYDRSTKLKKRATKLQQFKEKESLQKETSRESKLHKEQDLIASTSSTK